MKLLGSVSSTGSEATLPAKNPKVKHYIMSTITLNQTELPIFDLWILKWKFIHVNIVILAQSEKAEDEKCNDSIKKREMVKSTIGIPTIS